MLSANRAYGPAGLVLCLAACLLFAATAKAENLAVTTTDNDGTGSLRAAIETAVGNAEADVITVTATGTTTLQTPLPNIDSEVTINGPGAQDYAIDGNQGQRIFTVTPTGDLTVTDMELRDGTHESSNAQGGAIRNAGTLLIDYVSFQGNVAQADGGDTDAEGGAIWNDDDLTVRRSSFSGNAALGDPAFSPGVNQSDTAHGGAIYNDTGGNALLDTVTISGNLVDYADSEQGSGVWNVASLTVYNSTLADPQEPISAGRLLHNQGPAGTTQVKSTIFDLEESCIIGQPEDWTSLGYNIDAGDTCALDQPTDQTETDAGLGALELNGGPTLNHAIGLASPALDQGMAGMLATDQRGEDRPQDIDSVANASGGDGSDVGAYEYQPDVDPIDPIDPVDPGEKTQECIDAEADLSDAEAALNKAKKKAKKAKKKVKKAKKKGSKKKVKKAKKKLKKAKKKVKKAKNAVADAEQAVEDEC